MPGAGHSAGQTGCGMTTITRPVLRYHGGKWRLAPWILSFAPQHRSYVEPFGGAASVLLTKARAQTEIYNDLDGRIVALFAVLRDPQQSEQLLRMLALTPYARAEHELSYESCSDVVEQARRTIIRGMMGHASRGATSSHRTGFRTARRRGRHAAGEWAGYPEHLRAIIERIQGVLIEHRNAIDVITEFDDLECLHYVDPPYPQCTRTTLLSGTGRAYAFEMSDEEHVRLAERLRQVKGMVLLSGYPCPLYDEQLYPDWERHETSALTDGRIERTEVLWLNPAASAALRSSRAQGELLEAQA